MQGDCLHSKTCFHNLFFLLLRYFAESNRECVLVYVCVCVHFGIRSQCITTHRSISILFLVIGSQKRGVACLSHYLFALSALLCPSACPLCRLSCQTLCLFPSFSPPDNTKGTLSSSQLDSGRVSGEHQTWDSFEGDHRSDWLYG